MTSDMTASGVGIGPELNQKSLSIPLSRPRRIILDIPALVRAIIAHVVVNA